MTQEHTPGPWAIRHSPRMQRYDIIGDVIQKDDQVYGYQVAELAPWMESEHIAANAALIAAAPDLLTALQTITLYLAEAHAEDTAAAHYGDDTCSYCDAIEAANRAIARATAAGAEKSEPADAGAT